MSQLASLLRDHKELVVGRWLDLTIARGTTASLRPEDLIDSMREFLDEVAEAIEGAHESGETARVDATRSAAAEHGGHRFSTGFDLATTIDEYRSLIDVVYEAAVELRCEPSASEWRVFSAYLAGSAAAAATEYTHARDVEVQRQTAEHLAFLAHELRNPLSSAMSGLAVLKMLGKVEADERLARVERNLERLRKLIDGTLVAARLQEVPTADRVPMHLSALVEDVLREAAGEAEAKEIVFAHEVTLPDRVEADVTLLSSAVSNLVRNAVKFSRNGGTVRVRASRAEGRAHIEVQDECGGIPPERIKSIFDPFVQVGLDRSGFGLGLAIAKQAALAHDGDVRVHNLPGQGCVFVLEIACEAPRRDA